MIVEAVPGGDEIRAVEAAARAAEMTDGVAPLGEQPLRALHAALSAGAGAGAGADDGGAGGGIAAVQHLMARPTAGGGDASAAPAPGAAPVGYAQLSGTGAEASAELVVHPDHRGRGIGTALVRAVLEREPAAAIWAHGDLPAARGLATALELNRTRELLKMRRVATDGPELPERRVDAGIELGTLAEAASEGGDRWPGLDARAEFLRVNNAAFSWHPEQGGWTRAQLDERLAVDWVDLGAVFLAVDTGAAPRLAGFHWTKTVAEPGEPVEGEVYVVAVDPADQGRGLGGVLTSLGVEHLEGPVGARSVVLYVEGDNAPAVRTYEKLGFSVAHVDVTYTSV
ncbi:mycothiol acetyltransferase [Dietzia sp. NCCP-2495]|uniref:mycothiol synthase n=1 Tax=Dietzia sp. NCCP-2495 TaxID=2934675 RepID=UPI0022325555|nr:mycothiol synthase [Dietzia sp. NCCP-2495]GLB65311.1 mycothiol acetyltransferase [Dietzia sp. NCCP-2495]